MQTKQNHSTSMMIVGTIQNWSEGRPMAFICDNFGLVYGMK